MQPRSILVSNAEVGDKEPWTNGFLVMITDTGAPSGKALGSGESNAYQWMVAASHMESTLRTLDTYLRRGLTLDVRLEMDRLGPSKRL